MSIIKDKAPALPHFQSFYNQIVLWVSFGLILHLLEPKNLQSAKNLECSRWLKCYAAGGTIPALSNFTLDSNGNFAGTQCPVGFTCLPQSDSTSICESLSAHLLQLAHLCMHPSLLHFPASICTVPSNSAVYKISAMYLVKPLLALVLAMLRWRI